jgi:hypothetical protein
MSKTLMTVDDIPKYVRGIASRMYKTPVGVYDGEIVGYTFTVYGRFKTVYDRRLEKDIIRLTAWAQRYYAESKLITTEFNKRIGKKGYVHFAIITITDPICRILEKIEPRLAMFPPERKCQYA